MLAKHLKAAAFELPLSDDDLEAFGPLAEPIAEVLCATSSNSPTSTASIYSSRRAEPAGRRQPAAHERQHVQHRAASQQTTRLAICYTSGHRRWSKQTHEVIANVDSISAPELVYPEAVYLHNGETYLVRELDLNGKVAYVERRETDYYTQAVLESNVRITQARGRRASTIATARSSATATSDVSWQTVAFKKIKFDTRENIGLGPVDIPAQQPRHHRPVARPRRRGPRDA